MKSDDNDNRSKQVEKSAVLGNEAIALGLYDAGIKYAASYPGTPSTEIMETLIKLSDDTFSASWSTNEAVAFEEAAATAITGFDAVTVCKSVGLNVAMDPLMTLAFSGVNAALVVVVADDPDMLSSQNEQDNRLIAQLSGLPMFEPSTIQECYDLAREAIHFSRRFKIPVFLRSVTRVSHALGILTRKDKVELPIIEYDRNPQKFVSIPGNARRNHSIMLKKYKEIEEYAEQSHFWIDEKIGEYPTILFLTSGSSANYVKEAIEILDIPAQFFVPKLIAPLPKEKLLTLMKNHEKLLVIEELEPYLERFVREIAQRNHLEIEIIGKSEGLSQRNGELTTDKAVMNIARILRMDFPSAKYLDAEAVDLLRMRPPILCPGCPHRSTYVLLSDVLKKKDPIYCNDIGCYSLGVLPPHNSADILICMGASIPMATSVAATQPEKTVVAIIGDSTFWHTGVSGLANAIWKESNILVVIMDNSTTAMTGGQPNPTSTDTKLDIARTVKAMGAWSKTINPMNLKESKQVVQKAIDIPGVKVIVSKYPCALDVARTLKTQGELMPLAKVDKKLCNGCQLCIDPVGCPALSLSDNKLAQIDPQLCSGCMYCEQHCRRHAIVEVPR
jgi:indolepyruvate ferredoxin oxidoreductase alpha subunit